MILKQCAFFILNHITSILNVQQKCDISYAATQQYICSPQKFVKNEYKKMPSFPMYVVDCGTWLSISLDFFMFLIGMNGANIPPDC